MPNSHHTKENLTMNFHTCKQEPRKEPRGGPETFCILIIINSEETEIKFK